MNRTYCPYCNGEIPTGMKFCPHCMTSLNNVTTLETPPIHKKRRYIVFILLFACAALTAFGIYLAVDNNIEKTPESSTSINTEAEKNSLPETQAEFSKEGFIGAINDYCNYNENTYFGIDESGKISFDDDNGLIIKMTDRSGAVIDINADKDLTECDIIVRISHTDYTKNKEHFDEIAKAVVLILFDIDLNETDGSFDLDGYSFEISSYDIGELNYSQYLINVKKSL